MGPDSPGGYPSDYSDESLRERAVEQWNTFAAPHEIQAQIAADAAAAADIPVLPAGPLDERPGSVLGPVPRYEIAERPRKPGGTSWAAQADGLVDALSPIRAGNVGDTPAVRLERSTRIARDLWQSVVSELAQDQSQNGVAVELYLLATLTENLQRDLQESGQAELTRAEHEIRRLLPDAKAPATAADAQEREAAKFDLEDLDGKVVARVTPKPVPVMLQVASPSHGEVYFIGLARHFPKHTVHARDCTAMVEGNNCELQSEDHYHIAHTSLSLEPLLEPGSASRAAFLNLLSDPSDAGIARFQREMMKCRDEPPEYRETQVSVPLKSDPQVSLSGVAAVHQGNRTRTNIKTRYVAEDCELSITELLAQDKSLIRSLVAASTEDTEGPAARRFFRDALQAAGRVDDIEVLDHATDLHDPETVIRAFFGIAKVTQAPAVMVGADNTLETDMQIHRGRLDRDTILADLGGVRDLAAPDPDVIDWSDIPVAPEIDVTALLRETIDPVPASPDDELEIGFPDGPLSGLDGL
jgi:hypothetical protein